MSDVKTAHFPQHPAQSVLCCVFGGKEPHPPAPTDTNLYKHLMNSGHTFKMRKERSVTHIHLQDVLMMLKIANQTLQTSASAGYAYASLKRVIPKNGNGGKKSGTASEPKTPKTLRTEEFTK